MKAFLITMIVLLILAYSQVSKEEKEGYLARGGLAGLAAWAIYLLVSL